MSRLSELIERYCPDGVEYRTLGELGTFYGGLTGKTKKDFGSGSHFVSYNNVYGNPSVDLSTEDYVEVSSFERQNTVHQGDVFFTISSENREEAGLTSVMTEEPSSPWYLNSFCTGWRLFDPELFLPDFLKHLLRGPVARSAISRTANGVTRFNISKPRLAKVRIPVPPIEVQREVVRILDEYTAAHDELVKSLREEARLRRLTISALCDKLILDQSIERKPIGEIGALTRGKRFTAKDYITDGIPCIHYGQIYTDYGYQATKAITSVRHELSDKLRYAKPNDLIIACTGENREDILKPVAWLGDTRVAVHDDCHILHHNMDSRYLAYAFLTSEFSRQKAQAASESKVVRVSGRKLSEMVVPVPPLVRQREIADSIETCITGVESICDEIGRELSLSATGLEVFRNQLLSFSERKG